jgi:hypothetical protein
MKRPTYTVEQLRESLARLEADPDPDATTRAQINAMRHELGEVLGVIIEGDACEVAGANGGLSTGMAPAIAGCCAAAKTAFIPDRSRPLDERAPDRRLLPGRRARLHRAVDPRPYSTEGLRDIAARNLRRNEQTDRDALFWLTVSDGVPDIGAYTNGFFEN